MLVLGSVLLQKIIPFHVGAFLSLDGFFPPTQLKKKQMRSHQIENHFLINLGYSANPIFFWGQLAGAYPPNQLLICDHLLGKMAILAAHLLVYMFVSITNFEQMVVWWWFTMVESVKRITLNKQIQVLDSVVNKNVSCHHKPFLPWVLVTDCPFLKHSTRVDQQLIPSLQLQS